MRATSELRSSAFVAAEMIDSGSRAMVSVRDEVADRLAALAADWTPDRTLGANERDLIALAGTLLAGGRMVMVVE